MNGKIAIAASIFAAVLMLVPGISMASAIQSSVHQYQVGNEKVIFEGNQSFIAFGNSSEKVSWIVEKITPSGLKTEHWTHFRVKRIVNAYQNSAILVQNNSMASLAEIFSFQDNMIDASVVITNLQSRNQTYSVVFAILLDGNGMTQIEGYAPSTINPVIDHSSSTQLYLIPSSDSSFGGQEIHVSWNNEMNLFHSGFIEVDGSQRQVALPFGPITLMHNQSYSIDPTITPQSIAPCPDCGGGGTSYSTPTVSDSVTSNESLNGVYYGLEGLPITLHADVTSLGGASSATLMFDVNTGGYYFYVHSQTIYAASSYSFTWYPPSYEATGYFDYQAYVENPEYTGHGAAIGLGIFQAAPSNQIVSVYNSSGTLIAKYTQGVVMDGVNWTTTYSTTVGTFGQGDTELYFGTAANWTSSSVDGVHQIEQTIGETKAIGFGGGAFLIWGTTQTANQGGSDTNLMIHLSAYLVQILNSISFGLIPNPSWFYGAGTLDVASTSNQSYTMSGEVAGSTKGTTDYYPIYAQNGSVDQLFGYKTFYDIFSANPSTYLALYTYSVTVEFETGAHYSPSFTYSSSSLTTGVYVPG